jgi:hypothetical protein
MLSAFKKKRLSAVAESGLFGKEMDSDSKWRVTEIF